jgi:cellulose synthase/poly-beta-1,6-N-acetylglucosamine synthase-like glycosyltransferase
MNIETNIGTILSLIITTIFLLFVLSYYVLLFIKQKKKPLTKELKSISIIIPAHNEERFLADAIESVLAADWKGKKEIIVVNDGSKDKTLAIAKKYAKRGVIIYSRLHSGKSASINFALKKARGKVIAIVDADSTIHKNALVEITKELRQKNTVAACCVIRVKNRKQFICMWAHIEQVYNSLMRSLFAKVNANVTTPGPLSVYKKSALLDIGGFSEEGYSEDVDVTIRLIRKGYHVGFSTSAIAETNMPDDAKGFFRQRTRFAKGMINVFKRHLRLNTMMIDLYTLPLLVFIYIQAIIMGAITLYNIISGYIVYFAAKGQYMSWQVLRFFFDWLSIIGFVKWMSGIFTGATPITALAIIGIASTLLTYPLYLYAIIRFDKSFDVWHLIPIFFMFPFWLFIMVLYIAMLPFGFLKNQRNIWKKNE